MGSANPSTSPEFEDVAVCSTQRSMLRLVRLSLGCEFASLFELSDGHLDLLCEDGVRSDREAEVSAFAYAVLSGTKPVRDQQRFGDERLAIGIPINAKGGRSAGVLIAVGKRDQVHSCSGTDQLNDLHAVAAAALAGARVGRTDHLSAQREAGLHLILEQMDQGLTVFDKDAQLVAWNQRYIDLFELPQEVVFEGVRLADLIAATDLETTTVGLSPDYDEMVRQILQTVHSGDTVEAGAWLKNGRFISARQTAMPDGGWVATYTDMTKRVRSEEKVRHASEHDSMTGLMNRAKFTSEYERLSAEGSNLVTMLIDIDHFKSVNDRFGHGAGDAVIMEVAERLRDCVRKQDIVARLGGDEFAVLVVIDKENQTDQAQAIAQSIVERMARRLEFEDTAIEFSVSIGAYKVNDAEEALDRALSRADYALYKVKQDGRGKYRFFDALLAGELDRSKLFSSLITQETYDDKLGLFYQPIVCLQTGHDRSYEALIRWQGDDAHRLSPMEIIDAAEQAGAIAGLGEWVLNRAIEASKHWDDHARLAVNISPKQLGSGFVLAQVRTALQHHQFAPSRLELEVTETAVLQDDRSLTELHDIKALGVKVSLDDFGTGYSSLMLLQRFAFDKLKIDRSFVGQLESDPLSHAIVRSVVGLGREVGVETVAEGIGTQRQRETVTELGCALGQGFLLGRPVQVERIAERRMRSKRAA